MPKILQQQEITIQEQINNYKKEMALWFNKRYYKYKDERAFTFEDEVWLLKKSYSNNGR